jgi:hypothetical protein
MLKTRKKNGGGGPLCPALAPIFQNRFIII